MQLQPSMFGGVRRGERCFEFATALVRESFGIVEECPEEESLAAGRQHIPAIFSLGWLYTANRPYH